MLKLGITGGIGSGKSTVCRIFSYLGVPVFNADDRAKWLVNNNQELRQKIVDAFGDQSFINGEYNRPYIAHIVFSDKSKLEKLNQIIHPAVLRDWEEFCSGHAGKTYVIKEAAILIEAGGNKTVDRIALVYSPLEQRIQRLMERDKLDRQSIESRISSQMPEEEKLKLADYIIYNDQDHSLLEQVRNIHQLMQGSTWMS